MSTQTWLQLWRKRIALLAIYMLPAVVGVSVTLYFYVGRTREAMTHVGCAMVEPEGQSRTCEKIFGGKRLDERIKSLGNKGLKDFLEQQIGLTPAPAAEKLKLLREDAAKSTPDTAWFFGGAILFFTLLPFGTLGVKLAMRFKGWNERVRDFVASSNRSSFLVKLMLALIISGGCVYLMNPDGVAVGTVGDWVQNRNILGQNSQLWVLNNLPKSPLSAAFFGWYLNVIGYFFIRARRADVRSTGLYNMLLRKYLFTVGISVILNLSPGPETTVAAFFIGFIPIEAIAILKELGIKTAGALSDPAAALLELPGMTRWEVLRLQEEGIDTVTSLTDARREDLKESLAVEATVVDQWIDTAALVAVLGVERYQKVKGLCLTGPVFVDKAEGAAKEEFRAQIKLEAGISNIEEIAELVKRRLPSLYARAADHGGVARLGKVAGAGGGA